MAFDKTWPEPYPPEGGYIRDGNDQIRDGWYAVRERLAVDHQFFTDEDGESNIGCHKKATLLVQSSNPTAVASAGILYTKDVSDKAELFWEDEDGTVLQMTSGGAINGDLVPSGLISIWSGTISAIPTGWSLCDGDGSTPNLTDKMIRGVSSGTNPGGTGGADTHTTPSHTLTSAEMPAHTHSYNVMHQFTVGGDGSAPRATSPVDNAQTTGSTGSDGGHTHSAASNLPAYYAIAFIRKD